MIVTVGEASPRQARGHIGDGCVKWKHFLNDVADVADQTGTVRGRIKRVEMSLKPCFHMIVAVIVSICRRLIGDTSPMCRSRSPTVTIIWKPGFTPPLPSPFSYIFFVCQSFLVIICSFKVYLKLDVTRERARQTCHKGANLIASYKNL